jgi:hypothetical protein
MGLAASTVCVSNKMPLVSQAISAKNIITDVPNGLISRRGFPLVTTV